MLAFCSIFIIDKIQLTWTMVVECIDAVITHGAMRAPWWPVKLACNAPLHPYRDSIDFSIFVEGSAQFVLLVFV